MKRYIAYLTIALLSFLLPTQVQGRADSCAYSSGVNNLPIISLFEPSDDQNIPYSQIVADTIHNAQYAIYFQKNSMAIDKEYLDNSLRIARINNLLLQSSEIDSITIYVYSSPEGPRAYNNSLAERRAVATRDFLLKNLPANRQKELTPKIHIRPMGENWEGLKAELDANYHRQNRAEVLSILNSQTDTEAKKQQLQRLDNNHTYSYIVDNHSPKLRVAFLVWAHSSASAASQDVRLGADVAESRLASDALSGREADLPINKQADALSNERTNVQANAQTNLQADAQADILQDSLVNIQTYLPADEQANIQADLQADEPTDLYADLQPHSQNAGLSAGGYSVDEYDKKTILALKSNLLYDALTLINGSVEVPIGDKFSALAYSQFPWWRWGESKNETCIRFLSLGTEARWWFAPRPQPATAKRQERDRLVGHFAGVYAESGMWDFQFKRNMCRQGEFWSVGVSYGYAMPISRHLNLEFSLSVGYASIPYRGYTPSEDYEVLWIDKDKIGTWSYFGPTKLQVSLVVPIKAAYKKGGRR